jgi:hypothetical protein
MATTAALAILPGLFNQVKLYLSFSHATSFIAVSIFFVRLSAGCGGAKVAREAVCLGSLLETTMVFNFEQVHNYYERLVFEEVARRSEQHREFTPDMLGDVACVALNRLPARYVRHDVDLMFYLTEQERHAIELSLEEVLQFAFAFVLERSAKSAD